MNLLPRDRLIAAIAQTVIFWGGFGSRTNRGHICPNLSWLDPAALMPFDIRGIQMIFCDTAGLRAPKNRIEEYGIKKALETGKKSYINVILIKKKEEIEKYNKIFENILFVQSKNDKKNIKNLGKKVIKISSKNGFGINVLLDKIYNKINTSNNPYSNPRITQERHRQLLNLTLENLLESNKIDQIDLIAEEIRSASSNISKITGKNDIDDILDIIFNDFCIGK